MSYWYYKQEGLIDGLKSLDYLEDKEIPDFKKQLDLFYRFTALNINEDIDKSDFAKDLLPYIKDDFNIKTDTQIIQAINRSIEIENEQPKKVLPEGYLFYDGDEKLKFLEHSSENKELHWNFNEMEIDEHPEGLPSDISYKIWNDKFKTKESLILEFNDPEGMNGFFDKLENFGITTRAFNEERETDSFEYSYVILNLKSDILTGKDYTDIIQAVTIMDANVKGLFLNKIEDLRKDFGLDMGIEM